MDMHRARRLFSTPSTEKVPISKGDLRRGFAQFTQTGRVGRFAFAEDEAVARTLAPQDRGGFIVFPSRCTVGPGILCLTVSWLFKLYDQPHWLDQHAWMEKVEMGLPFAGHPFGNALSRCFRGRCRGPAGVWFTEKSWVLRVLFISKTELIRLGVALSRELQQPVLLKSVAKGGIHFVRTDDPDNES